MRHLNFDLVRRHVGQDTKRRRYRDVRVHKRNEASQQPMLSIVLVDWECRERFDPLDWLAQQDVPRHEYELIWVELYRRVVPVVMEKADVVITCGQQGMYHKHAGYNVGLLHAQGELLTICDSDAVFPSNFVSSIFDFFCGDESYVEDGDSLAFTGEGLKPAVLMHYEARSSLQYPDGLTDADELTQPHWQWWGLHPNVGACMTVRTKDAIRYGGFDEHVSYRGYLCGPYDLGWRLVNAGLPEVWCPPDKASLYHFAHPDPTGVQGILPSFRQLREMTHPHVDLHAWIAVEHFSTGRMLPLDENPEIFERRLSGRRIGTEFEAKYARMTGQDGFSTIQRRRMQLSLVYGILASGSKNTVRQLAMLLARKLGRSERTKRLLRRLLAPIFLREDMRRTGVGIVYSYLEYNFVPFRDHIVAIPKHLGPYDLFAHGALEHPELLVGESVWEIRDRLDRGSVPDFAEPVLVYQEYKRGDFNIFVYRGKCYGRRRCDGPFELDDHNLAADTVQEMKAILSNMKNRGADARRSRQDG